LSLRITKGLRSASRVQITDSAVQHEKIAPGRFWPPSKIHFPEQTDMKATSACTALLLVCLSGPALAKTLAPLAETCNLSGRTDEGDIACKTYRIEFRKAVSACMVSRKAEAEARSATPVTYTAHSYRSRYVVCSKDVRSAVGK
jgi:hypothetical protein